MLIMRLLPAGISKRSDAVLSTPMLLIIPCVDYVAGRCRSCGWLELPYAEQLARKDGHLKSLLAERALTATEWLPPVASAVSGFRNRAKMVVSGSIDAPLLGIVNGAGEAVDLQQCPLYPEPFRPLFAALQRFIRTAALEPYDIGQRRGELKYLLINRSQYDGGVMLRFVLRSKSRLDAIRKYLPELLAERPELKVVSVNLQPVHMAVLEGEQEIVLTAQQALREQLNQVPLYLRPKSFFQTNPDVAAALYRTAAEWTADLAIRSLWDLFCGVGGFGLHCVRAGVSLVGIEREAEAIACAEQSAREMGLADVRFAALDASGFVAGETQAPDLVLVNPPRRGIGAELCQWLAQTAPQYLLYSSCNAESLARDLALLPDYQLRRVQLFDLFPHTDHYETLALLVRTA